MLLMSKETNQLRDYQKETIACVYKEWETCRSVMVQMPTGTGKTHVLAHIVNEMAQGKMVLIVAHRVELVAQINEKVDDRRVVVASIQAIARRIDKLDYTPDLVVIDEAHHALANTYRILWDKWPKAKFLGLTATPCRMNRTGFTDLFDRLVTSWSIAEFIERGVLSAFDYVSIRPNSRDQQLIDSLQKRGADGDYQVKEMNEVLNRRPSIERLYKSMTRFAEGKKGIVYAISIDHAKQIAKFYNQQGVNTAAIDSTTPMPIRKHLVEEFKKGTLRVLVNVDVFSEGFDCPDVEFVQMARPTLSLAKYLQQVGRGLRKTVDKVSCMLIDNVGLYRVFGLPVVDWNWERMFRGETAGKGVRMVQTQGEQVYYPSIQAELPGQDIGVGLVVSHDSLLAKLEEWSSLQPMQRERTELLKVWQDPITGDWGLKLGREKVTEAEFAEVFDIKENMAAVRFADNRCGLVDDTGKAMWKRSRCRSLKFIRNQLLEVVSQGGKVSYVDLLNLQTYETKPEVKRFGSFELLKVKRTCYSRTRKPFKSSVDFESMIITPKGYYLCINECKGMMYALLAKDDKECYRIYRRLADGSMVVADGDGKFYRASKEAEKVYMGCNATTPEWKACSNEIKRLEERIRTEVMAREEEKKRRIQADYENAVPYQSGLKWGLKVGDRITVPPIYRNMKPPVGKYCAVEKNYSQWGVISIDGTVMVEPKYPDVTIEGDGTVLLTQVTGKVVAVKLK